MLKKSTLLAISFLVLNQGAAYALGENNSRLQYLLKRAKARSAKYKGISYPETVEQKPVVQERRPVQQRPAQQHVHHAPVHHHHPHHAPAHHKPVHHHQPVQHEHVHHAPPAAPAVPVKREPVVIKTHPQQAAHPIHHEEPAVQVKQETQVVQPPVQTLIGSPSGHIHTQPVKNSTIHVEHAKHQPQVIETHHPAPVHHEAPPPVHHEPEPAPVVHHEPAPIVEETVHEPIPEEHEAHSYEEVTEFLDTVLKPTTKEIPVIDLRANEQEQINQVEEVAEPVVEKAPEPVVEEPVAEETVEPAVELEEEVPAVPEEPKVEEPEAAPEPAKPTINPDEEAKLSQKDSDYLLVVRKSLKSLEDDPWTKVKTNMDEALEYFDREQNTHSDKDLSIYHKIVLACKRFSEGGLELDEGDFADFEEAEALYLDTQDLLMDVNKQLHGKNDYQSLQIQEIVNALLGYTEEELEYITEMLGM